MSTPAGREGAPAAVGAAAIFLISAAVISLELGLMRCLSIARWHHFSYLVISTALLGFGASGTLLSFVGPWLRRHFDAAALLITLLFAVSVSLSFRAAEALPLDPQYVLYSWRHAFLMFAYHFLLFIPFLLAATVIGLSLVHFGRRVHFIYGASLVGSGMGGALALGLMYLLPAERLLHAVAALAAGAALLWALCAARRQRKGLLLLVCLVGAGLALESAFRPLELKVDEYKALGTMRLWESEGNARRILTRHSPRARLDVYDSPAFHRTMFASLTARGLPPAQLAILADGDLAAPVFKIASADQAQILDYTPMTIPYRLVSHPRVLLLGEGGGANVWLARRMGAAHVTVVQSNPQLIQLLKGPLADMGGGVLSGPDVTVVTAEPRLYLERSGERFDVIQLVGAEALAAGTSGMLSLHEDFLLTRQGLALCIEHLTDQGILAVTRGTQAPPRDNLKIFATLHASLASSGLKEPGSRLVQVRNWVAATTLAFASPVTAQQCRLLEPLVRELNLDVEWAPCPGLLRSEQTHHADGPEGKDYSWFRHGALEILAGRGEGLFRDWVYHVRPATDDSPYFYNFFRWKSLPRFIKAYGPPYSGWLRRLELGYVVLVFALAQVVVVGAVLILLPLVRLRPARGVSDRFATFVYFTLLGLAYLMLEMVCILMFARFLGDPIYAAAGVLTSFLVFSGLGSAASRRLCPSPRRAICVGAIGAACLAVAFVFGLDAAFGALVGLPLTARFAASIALAAPLAFLMGWPFPNGLAVIQRRSPALVPWAWGTNGFASVAASPLAVMIAIASGFRTVLLLTAVLYLLAAVVSFGLNGKPRS